MKQGDFTELASHYVHRPGYSSTVIQILASHVSTTTGQLKVADIGAGTGKLTDDLLDLGISVHAVEPNDSMLAEGKRHCKDYSRVFWIKGSAEQTCLPDSCFTWILMGSSFHWTDARLALREFDRILVPGGFFTALWNPRDLPSDPLQRRIDERIREIVPELRRVSSGSSEHMRGIEETLLSSGRFDDCFFVEAKHVLVMSKERYLGVWRSVNDIRVQAGEERFREIMKMIESEISRLGSLTIHYKTRSWTVQKRGNLLR
jgi:ubiquinone/menaquinone biosynthesis C-methylase UbiE